MSRGLPLIIALGLLGLAACVPRVDNSEPTPPDDINPQGITMRGLLPGRFFMGCTPAPEAITDCHPDASLHRVTLTNRFWLGETEVTWEQWQTLMGEDPPHSSTDYPVVSVNWWEMVSFANTLSAAEGLAECYSLNGCTIDLDCTAVDVNSATGSPYDCEGYRLPTEAEWEYAARAGTDLLYAGSNTLEDVAWGSLHSVATKLPNDWGLYDMSGNASEWVWDRYSSYPTETQTDPDGPDAGPVFHYRSSRGFVFESEPTYSLLIRRDFQEPDVSREHLGFRIARTAP